jgi:hypothetical protein
MGFLLGVAAIVQLILHYLGWAGVVLGVLAIVVGSGGRGTELLLGGFGFIVLKYVIGFLFLALTGAGRDHIGTSNRRMP